MKRAVNALLQYDKLNKKARKEFGVPLETLHRKVNIAKNGVEKKLGRLTVLSEEAESELTSILLVMEAQLYRLSPVDVR